MLRRRETKERLAFVILTWNSEHYIADCIESVLSVDCFEILVLVIDNGSTDGTLGILDSFADDPRLIVIKLSENIGTTKSRNIALRAIPDDYDYVCVLDSDTRVNGKAFEVMAEVLVADPTIGVVGPQLATSAGVIQLSGRNLPTLGIKLSKACPISSISYKGAQKEVPDTPEINGLRDVGYLLSACWMMPRNIFDEVGYLDEAIFYAPEDVDFCVRIKTAGRRVVFCKRAQIVHEYQRISKQKLISKSNIEHVKGLVHYFRKHGYLFNAKKLSFDKSPDL